MLWLQQVLFGGTLPGMSAESREVAEQRHGTNTFSRRHKLQSFHKVLYDAVGELSPGLSEEAFSTLCCDARSLEMNQVTLNFRDADVEAEFQQNVAVRRRPILLLVFCFDVTCYLFRMVVKYAKTDVTLAALVKGMFPQLCNMAFLYTFLGLLNRRSRRLGDSAARQEEYMLTGIMTLAICSLLATINETNPQDYVYAAMFMISTTCFLKIQWLVGTSFMMLPLFVTYFWHKDADILPTDATVHLGVSWAVGGFMAFLSDTYRRQMFVNHRLAKVAAERELQEAQARIDMQQQLAVAQAQAAQRAITVAREKAANEAKSEFMSLMCHEVRTPLNGCLASAEMLLEMPLQEEQRDLAKTIRVSGSILLSTVSNFLDFFKMEAGKQLDVVRTEITTKELVADIHCIIEATIGRSSEVQLEKPSTVGVPDYVLGDPDRLRGILLNLYTNAAKFTKKGSIALRVRVASKDYRPSSAQVMAQQPWGPYTVGHASQAGGHQDEPRDVSWGTVNSVSGHKAAGLSSVKQTSGSQQLARTDSAPENQPAAAAEASVSSPDQAAAHGPGAKAAAHAQVALQRGQHAHNAATAIGTSQSITTPAACEHVAGQALLQRSVEVIDKAADKLQRDAGFGPGGRNQDQAKPSCSCDPLHMVQDGSSNNVQHEEHTSEPAYLQSNDVPQLPGAPVGMNLPQHRGVRTHSDAASSKVGPGVRNSSGRLSSSSVLDQPDEASSSGGSSPPQSKAEHSDQEDLLDSPLHAQRDMPESLEDANTAEVMRADPPESEESAQQERGLSGTVVSTVGEPTHSDAADFLDLDPPYCCSSDGLSAYQPQLRKSFSSPVDVLTEAADEAAAGHQTSRQTGGSTATSYNGMSSGKARVKKGVVTSVQDLGDGWFDTVAHRKAPTRIESSSSRTSYSSEVSLSTVQSSNDALQQSASESPFSKAPSPSDLPEVSGAESDEWLVFEVTDTGCGISQRGLGSLFTEYVQGTEDDMKRPRTRGGTGLGLSICSKQVSVLGGVLGAMSKLGKGSTFWFTIPLLRPAQSKTRESISMRRTASWGSRDAFTDGHISRHADSPTVPQGRRTLAATSKAHRQKTCLVPSFNYQAMLQQAPAELDSDNVYNIMQRAFPTGEAVRRTSAPEAPAGRIGGSGEKQRSRLRTANSDDSDLHSQELGHPIAAADFCAPDSSQRKSSGESRQHTSLGNSGSYPFRHNSNSGQKSQPGQKEQSQGQRKDQSEGNDVLQRNLLAPYNGARDAHCMDQSLAALSEDASHTFQAPSPEAMRQRANGGGLSARQDHHVSASSPSKPHNIRPSMEARRRRLGLSALQGRLVLLAEDNLINQRVAKMMLSSLGMTVEVASNGQEAVEAIKRRIGQEGVRQFDVLLMDMAMPVMGGVDATKEIRRCGAVVPIVAMTANSSDKDRDECLESGMDGFLSKPVLKDRLAEALLTAVSGRRQFQDRGTISLKAYDQLLFCNTTGNSNHSLEPDVQKLKT